MADDRAINPRAKHARGDTWAKHLKLDELRELVAEPAQAWRNALPHERALRSTSARRLSLPPRSSGIVDENKLREQNERDEEELLYAASEGFSQ